MSISQSPSWVDKQARKAAAVTSAAEEPVNKVRSHRCRQTCPPDFTFSKYFVICSSFRTSLIIDQGPNTSWDLAIRCRKNFSLSLCQSTSTPAHLSWWYSRRGPNMYLCCIQSRIYHSSVPHSLVYWPCHSSRWSWQIGSSNLHGDLFAALREVLNFKQNWSFNNDYINVPTYLSQDWFVHTANFLDTIFAVTRWMWNSTSSVFSFDEKVTIANRSLVPK